MEIGRNYQPSEFLRSLRECFSLFLEDQDLRFPTYRKQLALEIRLSIEKLQTEKTLPSLHGLAQTLIKEFETEEDKLSILEIWILWEWNERYRQIRSLLKILSIKEKLLVLPADPIRTNILERLREIEGELISDPLEADPSWIRLPSFRWRFAGILEELEYFETLL